MELTWPGVPVTACASMRPWRSNTPAERSPASRTEVENAVRIMVCACSSTTAIRRFHMIWVWIWASAAFGRATMVSPLAKLRAPLLGFDVGELDHLAELFRLGGDHVHKFGRTHRDRHRSQIG